jgi:cytochrome oxidase Cu insertion factor (SCO1/SenC/PrrC family)
MKSHALTTSVLATLLAVVFLMSWVGNTMAGGQGPQPARQTIDVSKLGPQVGQPVPDFSLTDQTGRTRNLQSIMGPRGAMVVFLRSADW